MIESEKLRDKTKFQEKNAQKKIKCIVWDLDNTLWSGVLLEDKSVTIKEGIVDVIKTLDSRGILQSIISKNDYEPAMAKLKEFGLDDFFLYPQINWNSKSSSIKKIAELMNIGIDTFAFVDDQAYEREEVQFSHPEVLSIDANYYKSIPQMPEMIPRFISDDSKIRRLMYQNDIKRKKSEEKFEGPKEEFLSSLKMVFTIAPAREEDLKRAEELTVRTHQLNTTGYTYSFEELNFFRTSKNHELLIADLIDKYGTYGKIGLALIEKNEKQWNIKLLLMSCRVMSRGVGTVFINHIRRKAKANKARLLAEMRINEKNRMMFMTYKFLNFREIGKRDGYLLLANDLNQIPPNPDYLKVRTLDL